MALTNSSYDSIMREYSRRRLAAISEAARIKDELYAKCPELSEIDETIARESVNAARQKLSGSSDAIEKLKDNITKLKQQKEAIIKAEGYSPKDLEPRYTCPDCQDTGYIGDEKCHCFKQEILNKVYEQSRLEAILQEENFEKFNPDYYSKSKVNDDNISAYDNAIIVMNKCKEFCDNFSGRDNILLCGQPGIGKTFLTHCMAKRLLDDLHSVIYLTADELIEVFEQDMFDREEISGYSKDLVLESDVLIIDDLGTEFVNSFTSSKIFTCINERLLREKSTVISTNLSLGELLEIYSERTFSRLSRFTILKLFGDDIRILKSTLR